jgi:hypothetical protein
MRKLLLTLFIAAIAAPLSAQRLNLDLPGLSEKAAQVVDVTLDATMLKLAAKFLGNGDPDERAAKDVVRNLEGIYVRSYTFDKDGEYDRALLERVRAQLGPTWKKMVNVRGRDEISEIYMNVRDDKPFGMLVMTAEPRELTLVNIVGPIDVDKLAALEGQFGVPHVHGKTKNKTKEKEKEKP